MALKDWKKIGIRRWRKKGRIVDVSLSKSDHHYMTKPAWIMIVKHERSNTFFEDNVFSSKAQALKKAKEYMKKN